LIPKSEVIHPTFVSSYLLTFSQSTLIYPREEVFPFVS
jgi:hypothetical protein